MPDTMRINHQAFLAVAESLLAGVREQASRGLPGVEVWPERELAEDVLPVSFNLNFWVAPRAAGLWGQEEDINFCDTTCCIAGAACALFLPRQTMRQMMTLASGPRSWSDSSWADPDFPGQAAKILLHDPTNDEVEVLRKWLFIANENSVWADHAATYGWDLDGHGRIDGWDQISGLDAAEILFDIASGEIKPPTTESFSYVW